MDQEENKNTCKCECPEGCTANEGGSNCSKCGCGCEVAEKPAEESTEKPAEESTEKPAEESTESTESTEATEENKDGN